MKKFLILIIAIFAFTTFTFAQKSSFAVQTGYSYSSGIIGVEYQFSRIGIAAGWFPVTQNSTSSFSAAVIGHSRDWDESGFYISGAFASAAYHVEDVVSPMFIITLGYEQQIWSGLSVKGGAGYSWCEFGSITRLEICAAWSFGL